MKDFSVIRKLNGPVLDLGSGGIVARLCKGPVEVLSLEEVRTCETRDALRTMCIDSEGCFVAAASFFSLMVERQKDRKNIISEVFSLLKPGAAFYIWGSKIEKDRFPKESDMFSLEISALLPDGNTINRTFAVPVEMDYYQRVSQIQEFAIEAGFSIAKIVEDGEYFFFMKLVKP